MKEYSVLQKLPNNGQKVQCFGHSTYCCFEDMDEEADWHDVTFEFVLLSYKLKDRIPDDPEESVLELIDHAEYWRIGDEVEYGVEEHVIGVTKWRSI